LSPKEKEAKDNRSKKEKIADFKKKYKDDYIEHTSSYVWNNMSKHSAPMSKPASIII